LKKSCRLENGVDDGEASQLIKAPGLETELSKWEAGTKGKSGGEACRQARMQKSPRALWMT